MIIKPKNAPFDIDLSLGNNTENVNYKEIIVKIKNNNKVIKEFTVDSQFANIKAPEESGKYKIIWSLENKEYSTELLVTSTLYHKFNESEILENDTKLEEKKKQDNEFYGQFKGN